MILSNIKACTIDFLSEEKWKTVKYIFQLIFVKSLEVVNQSSNMYMVKWPFIRIVEWPSLYRHIYIPFSLGYISTDKELYK